MDVAETREGFSPREAQRWLVRYRRHPLPRLRMFCFPYAGGGASIFRPWLDWLPDDVELCAIQLPGREWRLQEPPVPTLLPLVQSLLAAINFDLFQPFVFFGYSMGALLGFELARQIRRSGLPDPIHLFVAAYRAPQLPLRDPPRHSLPDSEFLAELRRLSGTPDQVFTQPELLSLLLPTLRADFAVSETYRYKAEPPLDCSISAYGGIDDTSVEKDDLIAWRHQSRREFTLQLFPGNHFFFETCEPMFSMHYASEIRAILAQVK